MVGKSPLAMNSDLVILELLLEVEQTRLNKLKKSETVGYYNTKVLELENNVAYLQGKIAKLKQDQ